MLYQLISHPALQASQSSMQIAIRWHSISNIFGYMLPEVENTQAVSFAKPNPLRLVNHRTHQKSFVLRRDSEPHPGIVFVKVLRHVRTLSVLYVSKTYNASHAMSIGNGLNFMEVNKHNQ